MDPKGRQDLDSKCRPRAESGPFHYLKIEKLVRLLEQILEQDCCDVNERTKVEGRSVSVYFEKKLLSY